MTVQTTDDSFVETPRSVAMLLRTDPECFKCGHEVAFRVDKGTVYIERDVCWSRKGGDSANGYEVAHKRCLNND